MATEIKLPRLGQGMESGTIVKWLKSEGEQVEKGEPLYELDTDKVTQEVEADASGVLLKIAVQEGEVPVGRTIAVIGQEGEEVEAREEPKVADDEQEEGSPAPAREQERERGREASAEPAAQRPVRESGPVEGVRGNREVPSARTDGRVKASPLARRIARERGVDLAQIRGTGPEGRVVAEDVERAAATPAPTAAPTAAGEVESRPLSNVRRTIARRLTEAWAAPVFQLTLSADMTRATALVGMLRERNPDVRVTLTDVLTKVCAAALMRHREVNVQYTEDALLVFPTANVGIAVAAPSGLIVPVIQSAERRSVVEIAAARTDLVARAKDGKLQASDLEGGTFTISNLGMYGVEQFVAVLNPPQAAILAVAATEERAVVVDGALTVRPMMTMTGTFDHRAVDGAAGADFLRSVKEALEEPGLAL